MRQTLDLDLVQKANARCREYSHSADSWQKLHLRSRMLVLLLGLLTAVAGAFHTTLNETHLWLTTALYYLSIILPLLAAGVASSMGFFHAARRWIAYRTGVETLKSEAFLYATATEKYARENRDRVFAERIRIIVKTVSCLRDGKELADQPVPVSPAALPRKRSRAENLVLPTGPISPEEYLHERLRDQQRWYALSASIYQRWHVSLTTLVFLANVVAAGLSFFQRDVWVPVLTTLVGALTTYSALLAADFLANSYRNTARHLADLEWAWAEGGYGSGPGAFRNLVMQVELVITREHSAWVTVLSHVGEGRGIASTQSPFLAKKERKL